MLGTGYRETETLAGGYTAIIMQKTMVAWTAVVISGGDEKWSEFANI